MNYFSLLVGASAPTDLWNNLISWLHGSIGNIGWAILLLTLLVKLVTSPLDFMVKYSTKKQTLIQQKCAPQVAKLQKKFGSDRQRLQIQTNALYKKEGLNMGVGCIVMLVNMILTCTIFFTFYSSLRTISAYQAISQYETIYSSYETSYKDHVINNSTYTAETVDAYIAKYDENYVLVESYDTNLEIKNTDGIDTNSQEYKDAVAFLTENESKYAPAKAFVEANQSLMQAATEKGSESALKTWNENKDSWLWVQNIWVADAPTNVFPTYGELKTTATNANGYYSDYVSSIDEADYNAIASIINNNNKPQNGFYILAILAGVITFLAQYISELHNKLKNKKASTLANAANPQAAGSMKILKIIMPVIMIIFVLTSSASFGIYLLASNIAGIAFGEIINLFVNLATKKKRLEVEEALEKEADRLIRKGKLQE